MAASPQHGRDGCWSSSHESGRLYYVEAMLAHIHFPAVAEMSPEQRAAYDEAAAGPRGHAPAPMAAWILNPEFARRAQSLSAYVRFRLSLPSNLRELAVLVVARYWAAHHE